MKSRLRFTSSLLCGTCGLVMLAAPLQANEDWFERLDQQYESTFQATDAAFDRALHEGVESLDQDLSRIWGDARRLPDAKVWVGYSADQKSRVTVDYDKGEISVERFDASPNDALQDLQSVLFEDTQALDERALLRRRLIAKTRELNPRPRWQRPDLHDVRNYPTPDDTNEQRPSNPKPEAKAKPTPQWQAPRNELARLVQPNSRPTFVERRIALPNGQKRTVTKVTIPMRGDRDRLSAQAVADPVAQAAEKYNLPRALILSVIKNESAFNPRARSHANAMGLMQVVATSGGKDAYEYLYGEKTAPPAEVLYDPFENIMLGATYLHLLNTRYFGKVTDPTTRRHLIIAAYNTGAGNVAKAFTGTMKLRPAIEQINQMTPQAVYDYLRQNLPYQETRTYLAKVSNDLDTFAEWDRQTG